MTADKAEFITRINSKKMEKARNGQGLVRCLVEYNGANPH